MVDLFWVNYLHCVANNFSLITYFGGCLRVTKLLHELRVIGCLTSSHQRLLVDYTSCLLVEWGRNVYL